LKGGLGSLREGKRGNTTRGEKGSLGERKGF
jgi:hypothetical protein